MRIGTLVAAVLFSLLAATAHAQWRDEGKTVPDTEWSKSAGEFGAMLLVTDDPEGFFKRWDKPPSPDYKPEIETVSTARRGETVMAIIIFTGCASNPKGNCVSEVDFKVLNPDGSLYGDLKKGELWKDKPAPPDPYLQVSVANLAFKIEEDDPFGTYQLEAVVRDMVAKKQLKLKQTLEVITE